jgi:3-dehydroquinate dehydratase
VKQALIIGNTEVLAPLTPWLVKEEYWVTVINHSSEKLSDVVWQAGKTGTLHYVTLLDLDYHDEVKLRRWTAHVQLMQGPLDFVVSWIEEPKEAVVTAIFEEIGAYRHDSWRWIDVIGSVDQPIIDIPRTCQSQWIILPETSKKDDKIRTETNDVIAAVKFAALNPEQQLIRISELKLRGGLKEV